jgi:CHAD domain-containing protein
MVIPAGMETIGEYSLGQVSTRMGHLVFQVHASAANPDADGIHDLRVAIRRFDQSLKVFSTMLPAAGTKRVRKRLRKTLDLAGAVRDKDICLEFLDAAGAPRNDPLRKRVLSGRKKAEKRLIEQIGKWSGSDFSATWRSDLQLVKA